MSLLRKTFLLFVLTTYALGGPELQKFNEAATWQVEFTPSKRAQQMLIGAINEAQKSIRVQAYSFTDREVSDALIAAHKRGVDVQIILDKSNATSDLSKLKDVRNAGIQVRIDYPAGIAHNKVTIIDERTVVTGSYNYSESAYKRNTENIIRIDDENLAKEYLKNWNKRWLISKEK